MTIEAHDDEPSTTPSTSMTDEDCMQQLAAIRNQVDHLQLALTTNRRIGAAVGILMAMHQLDYDTGYALLVKASQTSGRKLRDIAEDVILTGAV